MIVKLQTLTAARLLPESLAGIRANWTELAGDHAMSEPAWLENAWRFRHSREPGVNTGSWRGQAVTDPDGRLCGLAPWFVEARNGVKKLRLAGSGQVCSDYVQLPSGRNQELDVAEAVAHELVASRRKPDGTGAVDLIEIEGHRKESPQWERFFAVMGNGGWNRISSDIEGSWRIELPATWAEFESRLHKSRRRKARRGIKLLEKGEIEHRVYDTVAGVEEAWPEFVRLHQMRREQLGQPGCFSDPGFEQFLRSAILELVAMDRAWLSMVWQDQKPLAVLLMIDSPNTSFMYQSGIDVSRLQLAPGHIVNALTIRHAISREKQFFDLLRGDEPYKAGWMAERIPLRRTRLFAPTVRGRSLHAVCSLRNSWRLWQERRKETLRAELQEDNVDED